MRLLEFSAAAALTLATTAAAAAADPALQAKIETCFACHGTGGVSTVEAVPSIAGQPDLFIQWQLVLYRNGKRQNELMSPAVAELNDDDVRAIGAYLATVPPPPPPSEPDARPDLTAAGAKLATERRCSSCHTEIFAGQQAAARLAGQREEVLAEALHDYKAGRRFGTGVASMPEIAYQLSEDEITALAHYLSRLPPR